MKIESCETDDWVGDDDDDGDGDWDWTNRQSERLGLRCFAFRQAYSSVGVVDKDSVVLRANIPSSVYLMK